jgi:hypothetical protein
MINNSGASSSATSVAQGTSMAVFAIAHVEDEDKHAWLPGHPTTLCGIEVSSTTPREYRRFPPARGSTCRDCVALAWQRYGRG